MNLRKGKQNALSRSQLKALTGLDDRVNRCIIEDLRNEGIPIISSSETKGYWLPTKIKEVEHCKHEFNKRAKECIKKADLVNAWLIEHANELEDV